MIIFQVSKKSLDGKSSKSIILVEGFRHRSHTHDHKYVIDSHILIPFNSYPLRGRGRIETGEEKRLWNWNHALSRKSFC